MHHGDRTDPGKEVWMPYLPRQLSAVLMVVGALFTGPMAAGAGAAVSHGDLLNKDKQILEEQEETQDQLADLESDG